ncbi:uncharacterized protein LOC133173488 [Saccostrea echinata]|uniref:uncharacterized protein LOC133173488 n=1 Tax=Saccostrea echinata TaxID=191078 RepID=UPI002A823706|nr:uncharacterized protein LOC133173488 [Saccostrea echinata]
MRFSIFHCFLWALGLIQFGDAQVRFRNPWINVVRRHSCSIVECNFGETCDLSYQNCRESGPCFLKEPSCLTVFNLPRDGTCPDPRLNMIQQFSVDCFDDAGCDAPQICCHSFTGSYCWFPRTRQTVRSLIPRFTNRSVQRISENGTFVETPRDDGDFFPPEPRFIGNLPVFQERRGETNGNDNTVFIFRDPQLSNERILSAGGRGQDNNFLGNQSPDNRLISAFRDTQQDVDSGFSVFSDLPGFINGGANVLNPIETRIPNEFTTVQTSNALIPATQTNRQVIPFRRPNSGLSILRNRRRDLGTNLFQDQSGATVLMENQPVDNIRRANVRTRPILIRPGPNL